MIIQLMQPVCHTITVTRQPTNLSCGHATLSMLCSFFEDAVAPEEIMKDIPMLKNDDGNEWGTFGIDLAHWCMKRGYSVVTHSFDSQLVRLPWAQLNPQDIIEELKNLHPSFVFPGLGKNLTKNFIDAYIRYLSDKGTLIISPYTTTSLVYELLKKGPFAALVTYNALYGSGSGTAMTHFVVVYGCDVQGNILIADPWQDNGRKVIEVERLTGAIMSAQMTCENAVFQISKE